MDMVRCFCDAWVWLILLSFLFGMILLDNVAVDDDGGGGGGDIPGQSGFTHAYASRMRRMKCEGEVERMNRKFIIHYLIDLRTC